MFANEAMPTKRRRSRGSSVSTTASEDQTEDWVYTKNRVAQAAISILGTTGDIVHEALVVGTELFDFVPVPGLAIAAKLLLNIWDTLQRVDMNRLACLRVVQRCAEFLLSIRQEVHDAGNAVSVELACPVDMLTASFAAIHTFLEEQADRPFFKRFLKRDEILAEIDLCNERLDDSLRMFDISIQIRLLKQGFLAERNRAVDMQVLVTTMRSFQAQKRPASEDEMEVQDLIASGAATCQTQLPTPPTSPTQPPSPSTSPAPQILPRLFSLHSTQNVLDAARDVTELRSLMQDTLKSGSDAEMVKVFQIGREEMPEAIQVMQRALKTVIVGGEDTKQEISSVLERSGSSASVGSGRTRVDELWKWDKLDREFIESGIDALQRMSYRNDATSPILPRTQFPAYGSSSAACSSHSHLPPCHRDFDMAPTMSLPVPSAPSTFTSFSATTFNSSSDDAVSIANTESEMYDDEVNDPSRHSGEDHAMIRDERAYRSLLRHHFHPSLTLPLWSPSPVDLGAVGYLSRTTGSFISLFNSFDPTNAIEVAARSLPSLRGYGHVSSNAQQQERRNVAQRGLDAFVGLLKSTKWGDRKISLGASRRYSFSLRAGRKIAHLCTETTSYRYVETLDAPKRWLKANIDAVMRIYGSAHGIQKEDLLLVIGTLDSPDYALYVSHNNPNGQAHFNVFTSPKIGQPWGSFTTDTEVPSDLKGPSYVEPIPDQPHSAFKVSNTSHGGPWDTLLISRLRFKPGSPEPTSL
ncbi:hypothetical protein Hypma_012989 [Hypsizygus marmoreus]|uniref:Uncharacterized protein n=1 Tax=Hypsizygus marmoreus TaxID=39966 RepID=A0A369JDT7_HYPMA|nr:hypothetical protein Hypma_012989 [Hypsizygus marmoreus]